jgi:hypothetical protein
MDIIYPQYPHHHTQQMFLHPPHENHYQRHLLMLQRMRTEVQIHDRARVTRRRGRKDVHMLARMSRTTHHHDRAPNQALMYHTALPSHRALMLLWRCCRFRSDGLLLILVTGHRRQCPRQSWKNHDRARRVALKRRRRRLRSERFLMLIRL